MPMHCVVTGANRGLGLEFARQLAARGESVIATSRKPEEADELRRLSVRVEPLDLGDEASIASFSKTLGDQPIDLLINNAGMGVGGRSFESEDWDEVARFVKVNALGTARLTQRLLPGLRAGEACKVANITSKMGSIEDNTSGGAYGYRASKAALNMITKSMAIDLRREGICCCVLHPGWVATDIGGSGAPVSPEASVEGMLRVIDALSLSRSGSFYDYTGATVPW